MNRIINRILGGGGAQVKEPRKKKTYPFTMSFDKDGVCLGYGDLPGAAVLNIKHSNGKTTVVRKELVNPVGA